MTLPLPDLRERLIRAMQAGYYLRPYKPDQEMKALKKAAIQNIVDCILASPEWAEIEEEYMKTGEARGLERAAEIANAYPEAGRYDHSNEAVVWNAAQNIKDDIRALRPSPALVAVPRQEWERVKSRWPAFEGTKP